MPTLDLVLSWTRTEAGTTAIMRQQKDRRWVELARVEATEFTARGLTAGRAVVFAAAAVLADGGLAPEDEWETLRVTPLADDTSPVLPAVPAGFVAVQDGPSVHFRWDAATDGATSAFELRAGPSWEEGVLVARGLTGTSFSWPWSGSGTQSFHLKAVDRFGRVSADAASATLDLDALGDHATADVLDVGAGGWLGARNHLEVVGGGLQLDLLPGHFGAATSPFGSFAGASCFATHWTVGLYESPPFVLDQLERQRVEVDLSGAQPAASPLPFGAARRKALGSWAAARTIDVAPRDPVQLAVLIDTSPSFAGGWDGWRPYTPGTHGFRRIRYRVSVVGDGLGPVRLPQLVLTRRKLNFKQEGHVVVNCSPVDVLFPVPFQNPPRVTTTILGYTGTPIVSNVTATGFSIAGGAAVFDGDPSTFAPTVHWQAMGS